MNQKADIDIINRIKKGNPDAFEEIVARYEKPLFVYIINIVQHKETAEDVLQDVFLSAYMHLPTYNRLLGKFSTWIYRITRNRCLNELKKKKEIPEPDFPDVPGCETPSDGLLKKEAFQLLNAALDGLTFDERSIFILAEFEGLSYGEIARIETMKTGTVKSRLSRTREKLKAVLRKNWRGDNER